MVVRASPIATRGQRALDDKQGRAACHGSNGVLHGIRPIYLDVQPRHPKDLPDVCHVVGALDDLVKKIDVDDLTDPGTK